MPAAVSGQRKRPNAGTDRIISICATLRVRLLLSALAVSAAS